MPDRCLAVTFLSSRLLIPAAGVLALAAGAPPASARGLVLEHSLRAQPLSARPAVVPASLPWRDRVIVGGAARVARARGVTNPSHLYRTRENYRVRVTLSASYPDDPKIPRSYVRFLDRLPHGRELKRLSVFIAPLGEVQQDCGGDSGILACYTPSTHTMFVPGDDTQSVGGVSTKFVIAHEFGHHVATFRRNDPFDKLYARWGGTVAFGPKYWSSEKYVCAYAERSYFPGAEDPGLYLANPGEAWAETYAHLTYPDVEWGFAPSLRPTKAALRAARRDVRHPWTHYRHRTFRGALGPRHTQQTVRFRLRLDGRLRLRLRGPRGSDYDLRLRSGPNHDLTHGPGSRDHIGYAAACRTKPSMPVAVTVIRRHGAGPYRLRLSYAG